MEIRKITPFLWFDSPADEAAQFYCSVFKNSKIITANAGMAIFELEGQQFKAGNFGPQFKFNEAISLYVDCDTQAEVDYYWDKLTADGGQESRCGWLKDKFGLSWQIIPVAFSQMMSSGDPVKTQRVIAAMMKMNKMDIAKLQQAFDGE